MIRLNKVSHTIKPTQERTKDNERYYVLVVSELTSLSLILPPGGPIFLGSLSFFFLDLLFLGFLVFGLTLTRVLPIASPVRPGLGWPVL